MGPAPRSSRAAISHDHQVDRRTTVQKVRRVDHRFAGTRRSHDHRLPRALTSRSGSTGAGDSGAPGSWIRRRAGFVDPGVAPGFVDPASRRVRGSWGSELSAARSHRCSTHEQPSRRRTRTGRRSCSSSGLILVGVVAAGQACSRKPADDLPPCLSARWLATPRGGPVGIVSALVEPRHRRMLPHPGARPYGTHPWPRGGARSLRLPASNQRRVAAVARVEPHQHHRGGPPRPGRVRLRLAHGPGLGARSRGHGDRGRGCSPKGPHIAGQR